MKMETQLVSNGLVISAQIVNVATVADKRQELITVLAREYSPGHFDIAVEHQLSCGWRRWLSQ
ncbi:hypothetical protein A5630_04600 [Mycolicibacterium mucogenicum]|uniref:Uncharacterized protein n=1 Tax=Mycolicibacterium mucogenicum TaxID=56689 RepID=A0A1A3GN09_MYCMU|nr:hypothetical protein A5630_04600 [Mycolicibacterium mucogenicum]